MSKSSALIALSLCILVTYFWRSLPFLALRGKKLSPSLSRLGELLPPSIMAILLIYSTRSIVTGGASLRLSLVAGCLFTALIQIVSIIFHNLLSLHLFRHIFLIVFSDLIQFGYLRF